MYFFAGLIALVATASALRVVPVSFIKANSGGSLQRRATISEGLSNNVSEGAYFATVQVGTPAQTLTLVLDTGSSDVWVLASNASLCTNEALQNEYGSCVTTFDASESSTFEVVDAGGFSIKYEDESSASGSYVTDDFSIGGASVKNLQMGYATDSTLNTGLMGIGFDADEATQSIYPNLIDDLVSQGLITTKAYSLYLVSPRAFPTEILFVLGR